jgi:hypothetical protein
VHPLVRAVAQARSEANGSAQDAIGKLIARLTASYPEDGYDNPQSWPLCAKLTPHLLARRGSDDPSVFHLLGRTGEYFHGRAAYSQAAPLLRDTISRMSATFQQGLLTLQRKRSGGNQHVTVKHIHQQVNVTDGGQAVVAGDKVTSRENKR